jgi:hypothetical protein
MTATITAVAYLIAELTASGMKIADVLKAVEETGVVPQEEWDKLKADLESNEQFWKS